MKKYQNKFIEATKKYEVISKDIINLLNEFISLSTVFFKFEYSKSNIDIKELNSELKKFNKFGMAKEITDKLDEAIKQDEENKKEQDLVIKLCDKIIQNGDKIFKGIKSKNFNSVKNISVSKDFEKLQQYMKPLSHRVSEIHLNVLKNGMAFLFNAGQKSGLLSSFDSSDWKELNKTKFNEDEIYFNYLKDPSYKDDFEYFVYYINNISTESKEIELGTEQFQDYVKILYKEDPKFKKFKELVDKYLHSNKKELIPLILKELKDYPILYQENEERKLKYKTLYRGIGFTWDKDPIYMDLLKRKPVDFEFAATSQSIGVAEAFAKTGGIQILKSVDEEGNERRKWEVGLVIEYDVNPNSIIMDFEILGSVFFESEILINTKKSKIKDVHRV